MPTTEAALAWCNRDDYGWCGMHNRPFAHCKAEALDTLAAEREFYSSLVAEAFENGKAAERERIVREVEGLRRARFAGEWVDRAAVLAIVRGEQPRPGDNRGDGTGSPLRGEQP